MTSKHYPFAAKDEYFFKEGCFITETLNDPNNPSLSIVQARVQPNKKTVVHSLNGIDEYYVVIQGRATAYIGEISYQLVAGDVLKIAAGEQQSVENIGEDDLIFLAICTPRFKADQYTAHENRSV